MLIVNFKGTVTMYISFNCTGTKITIHIGGVITHVFVITFLGQIKSYEYKFNSLSIGKLLLSLKSTKY